MEPVAGALVLVVEFSDPRRHRVLRAIFLPPAIPHMPSRLKATPPSADAEGLSFEQSIAELDGIIQSLDGDAQGLDQLVEKYERGMGLLAKCQQQLDVAQLRIEQITRRADDGVELTPLSASPAAQVNSVFNLANLPPVSPTDEIRLF